MNIHGSGGRGFTLIELLVVISIISLLSSVVLSSLNTARARAANAKVLSEKRSLQTAVQMFTTDSGNFPYPGNQSYHCLGSSNCSFANTAFAPSTAGDLSSLTTTYVRRASTNPTVTISGQSYAGPLYLCNTVSSGRCTRATLYFTIANATTCPGGSTLTNLGTNGVLCEADAGGTGSSSTY